jgi:hypothetical protein
MMCLHPERLSSLGTKEPWSHVAYESMLGLSNELKRRVHSDREAYALAVNWAGRGTN